jgi:hypothetical protein
VAARGKFNHSIFRVELQRLPEQGVCWRHSICCGFEASSVVVCLRPSQGAIVMLSDNLTLTTYSYDVSLYVFVFIVLLLLCSCHQPFCCGWRLRTATTLRNRLLLHKRHIVEMLQDRICNAKSELYMAFTKADAHKMGNVCAAVLWLGSFGCGDCYLPSAAYQASVG